MTDFDALEDDVLFILHKLIVKNEVYSTLIVLSRLLNNKDDKLIRDKYKSLTKFQSELFPIQTLPNSMT